MADPTLDRLNVEISRRLRAETRLRSVHDTSGRKGRHPALLHQPSHDIERLDGLARSVRELGDRIAGHR